MTNKLKQKNIKNCKQKPIQTNLIQSFVLNKPNILL